MSDHPAPPSSLPSLYSRWIDELLGMPLPAENKATCSDCPMCAKAGRTPLSTYAFIESLKCCTYLPELPNYLAGRILSDASADMAAGRDSIHARIRARRAVTPLGLFRPPGFALLYRASPTAFGREAELRCPHLLDTGLCNIWRHRNAACVTFFCKFERGPFGMLLWRSVRQWLSAIEAALARWCLMKMNVGLGVLLNLFPPRGAWETADPIASQEPISTVDPRAYESSWGYWAGREAEFFRECAALTNNLSWADVMTHCGPEVGLLAQQVRELALAYAARYVPDELRPTRFEVLEVSPQSSRIRTYENNYDLQELPNAVLNALHHFDGRPTDQVLKAIAQTNGLTLTQETIRHLVDIGLLA